MSLLYDTMVQLRGEIELKEKEIERLKGERKELIADLRKFISMHETGLLPNKFVYEDAKITLNGMGE